jgi:uncharacterized protein YoxC
MAKKNDDQKFEQLRQEFTELVDELRQELEKISKQFDEMKKHIKLIEHQANKSAHNTMVVWEKTSGTLGDITRKLSDLGKPFSPKRKN